MRLIENYHVYMLPSCSANRFGSSKDENEDKQEDFTGIQYFKIPVEILWSCVEYCNHVCYLQYYRYVAVNFWRVKLWQILQFAKVFQYTAYISMFVHAYVCTSYVCLYVYICELMKVYFISNWFPTLWNVHVRTVVGVLIRPNGCVTAYRLPLDL